jgi:hypothetical protein
MLRDNVIKIWKNRNAIYEGIKNSVFVKEDIEQIAHERMDICKKCPQLDTKGLECVMPGTQPCCSECGCSLKFKTRALSSACPLQKWKEVLTEEEEITLKEKLGIGDE